MVNSRSESRIKPGILVVCSASITGGATYRRKQLSERRDGKRYVGKMETIKTVRDVDAANQASVVRGAAQNRVRALCAKSSRWMICLESKREELAAAIDLGKQEIKAFHREYRDSGIRIGFEVMRADIRRSDQEVVRGIQSAVNTLVEQMEAGIRGGDPKSIRDAANGAKDLTQLLDKKSADRVTVAIAGAREAARQIARRVIKNGEDALEEIVQVNVERVTSGRVRMLSLELDDSPPKDDKPKRREKGMPKTSMQRVAALDLED